MDRVFLPNFRLIVHTCIVRHTKNCPQCVTEPFARDITHNDPGQLIVHSFTNMLGTHVCADKRINAAVDLLVKAPMLSVSQAMRAANFTDEESKTKVRSRQYVFHGLNKRRQHYINCRRRRLQWWTLILAGRRRR
jgi:hypothetical protein